MFPNSSPNSSPPCVLDVFVSCDCFQTSMPLKWNCGSTVFALDVHPSRVQIVTRLTSVLYEGFQLWLVFLPQHFTLTSETNNQCWDLTELNSLKSGSEMKWNFSAKFHIPVFRATIAPACLHCKVHVPGLFFRSPCVFWTPNNTA